MIKRRLAHSSLLRRARVCLTLLILPGITEWLPRSYWIRRFFSRISKSLKKDDIFRPNRHFFRKSCETVFLKSAKKKRWFFQIFWNSYMTFPTNRRKNIGFSEFHETIVWFSIPRTKYLHLFRRFFLLTKISPLFSTMFYPPKYLPFWRFFQTPKGRYRHFFCQQKRLLTG